MITESQCYLGFSDLGGKAHSHLGLGLFQQSLNIDDILLAHTGQLILPSVRTEQIMLTIKEAWYSYTKALYLLKKANNVEKESNSQLKQNLPEAYIKNFCNVHSNAIATQISYLSFHWLWWHNRQLCAGFSRHVVDVT